ncbi:aminotransferase class IV [Chloroflexota bacterium]
MEDFICYYNGEYMKESEVKISLWDAALTEGLVYEIQRTYNHVPFFWEEHTARLFCSLRHLHIDLDLTPEEVHNISLEVFKRNEGYLGPGDDFTVALRVSRGGRARHGGSPIAHPTVLISIGSRLAQTMYERLAKVYQQGAHLVVANTRQIPPQCLDTKTKNSNKFCNSLANFEARMVDPEAAGLMLDIYGRVAEGISFNCFMVRNGKLLTPRVDNILGGITRATVLRLAKDLGIESTETDLYVYDLYSADEIFTTATQATITPVAKFNERLLSKPIPGPVTQQLFTAFSKLVGVDIVQRVISYVQTKEKTARKS